MSRISIRVQEANFSDAPRIAGLSNQDIESGLRKSWNPAKVKKAISDPRTKVLVAKTPRSFAGFGIMNYYQNRANLSLLAVRSVFRCQGIGTSLVKELQSVALANDIENIYVQVRQRNVVAIKFYESLGFEMIDLTKKYYQGVESAVIMYNYIARDVSVS